MLAQLVCLDRRYQRMNCFNMRELQALLKEKYYSELVNNYDIRAQIFNSINLRHKLSSLTSLENNVLLFTTSNLKTSHFSQFQDFTNQVPDKISLITYFTYQTYSVINFSRSLEDYYIVYSSNFTTLHTLDTSLGYFTKSHTFESFLN